MKNIIVQNRLLRGLVVGACFLAGELYASEYKEDFSGVAASTELKSMEGWALHNGKEGNAVVDIAAGFSGQGARVKLNEQYRKAILDGQALSLDEDKGGEFRIKLRIMSPNDGYTLVQILIGYNDGTHGLAVRFDGGTRDGSGDNFIRVSREGKSWGQIVFDDIKTATWDKETWYEIVISDIAKTSEAEVTGKVTIRKADDSHDILVENAPIGSIGGKGRFPFINVIVVGNCGTPKIFDIDDLLLKSTK